MRLSTRFASQWLRLQDLEKVIPDPILYPYSDQTLSLALKKETELFFNSLVREDRSVLDLLTADYTYVNERVARHYGIPNVTGPEFRRVTLPADRRGILGQGSILTLTSIAERTSPVQRGKWVMEVLLGSPPPPPPPNVPALEETKGTAESGRALSVRERMEQHRSNPQCTSCHRVIDPLGLALENFDATGKWRIRDGGITVDTGGQLFDGTSIEGPDGLRAALLRHKDVCAAELHAQPDDLCAGPPRRSVRHAGGAPHHPRRRSAELPHQRLRERHRRIRCVPDGEAARVTAAARPRICQRRSASNHVYHSTDLSRRTVLKGIGATDRAAVPRCDGAGAARFAQGRKPLRLIAMEMVHGAAGSTAFGIKKNMWSPAATGSAFDLSPTSLKSLEPYRDYLTIVSNTDVRNAEAFAASEIGADHFRSAAVFLTQSKPKQTQGSDVFAGTSFDQIYAQKFGDADADSVDAAVHRERRPGRRLLLQLLVRLHRHHQLGVARPIRCR